MKQRGSARAAKRAAKKAQRDPSQHIFNMMMGYQGTKGALSRLHNPNSSNDSETASPFAQVMQDLGADE